jgi:hypothetical protein
MAWESSSVDKVTSENTPEDVGELGVAAGRRAGSIGGEQGRIAYLENQCTPGTGTVI